MKTPLASFILMATLLASGAAAQTAPPAPAAPPATNQGVPKIQFAQTEYDFGKINNGAVVKFDFVFTNTGTATLEVTDVRPSCGCTTAGTWSKTVQPGQTGIIPIQFNSGNFSGPIHKTVTVTCNTPAQPQTILNLKGTIWKAIDVTPTYAYFTPQADTQTADTKVVRIVNNMDTPLELSPPEIGNKAFTAELKTLKEGKEFELRISANPPFGPGTVQGPVTVKTSSTNLLVITINAIIMVQPVIMAMPSQLSLAPGPLAAATKMGVTIRNSGGTNVTVSEPTVNLPGVEATVQELQPGRAFNIMLNFPAGFEIKPTERAELSVKTSHPQHPIIRVPIFQAPRPYQPQPIVAPPHQAPTSNAMSEPRPQAIPLPPPPPVPQR